MSDDNLDDLFPLYREGADHAGFDLYLRNREDTMRTDWHIEVAAPSVEVEKLIRSQFSQIGWYLDGKRTGYRIGGRW